MAFYEEFPDSDDAARALNNAAAHCARAGMGSRSMAIRHLLLDHPHFGAQTKYNYDQLGFLGYDYERIAEYERAASYYEKLWSLTPGELEKREGAELEGLRSRASDAIYSAAVLRESLDQWEQAIDNYDQFVFAFATDERVPEIRLRVGRLYEDHARWTDAARVSLRSRTIRHQRPPPPCSTSRACTTARLKMLVDLEALYTAVVNTGAGEWGLAALVALGKANETLAADLRTATVPSYLTARQADEYAMIIDDKAYLREEEAVNAFGLALDKS